MLIQEPDCLIIAEIGSAHMGELSRACELIDAAAESGAGCVKFQCIYADEIIHPQTGMVRLPGGDIELYDRFKTLEQPPDFYADLLEYTEKKESGFSAPSLK